MQCRVNGPTIVCVLFATLLAGIVVPLPTLASARLSGSQAESNCRNREPIYGQGRTLKPVSCGGVTIGVDSNPVGRLLPFAYLIVIWNDSAGRIDVDWRQWRITWIDRRGQVHNTSALDPDRLGMPPDTNALRRTTLFPGQKMVGFVYFARAQANTATVMADIPNIELFLFAVSAVPTE